MKKDKNLYDTLGVDKNASADEIKKAYKKEASIHHPDKQGGDNDKMTQIVHAYSVLGNAGKKDRYDKTGEDTEQPFDKKFAEFVQMFFMKIIEQERDVEKVDLMKKLKDIARQNIAGTKQLRGENEGKKKKLEKVLVRLEAKKENRISFIITANIDNIKLEIGALDEHLDFMKDVMECLDSYHYKFEVPEPKNIQVGGRFNRLDPTENIDWTQFLTPNK